MPNAYCCLRASQPVLESAAAHNPHSPTQFYRFFKPLALPMDPLTHPLPTPQSILKTTGTMTEEDVYVPVEEAREPWTLPASIFKGRAKEADARAFFDGGTVCAPGWGHGWGAEMMGLRGRGAVVGRPDGGSINGRERRVGAGRVVDMWGSSH
jgi:hypothetical protein